MFSKRRPDRVSALIGAPQSSVGAPLPVVLTDEYQAFVLYLVEEVDADWDGTTVRAVNAETAGEVAIAHFTGVWALQFGAPNDEALSGHPLADRGLHAYGSFVVDQSSWKAELRARNSVHPSHSDETFGELVHYILTFHDSTLECLARAVSFETVIGSVSAVTREVAGRLQG